MQTLSNISPRREPAAAAAPTGRAPHTPTQKQYRIYHSDERAALAGSRARSRSRVRSPSSTKMQRQCSRARARAEERTIYRGHIHSELFILMLCVRGAAGSGRTHIACARDPRFDWRATISRRSIARVARRTGIMDTQHTCTHSQNTHMRSMSQRSASRVPRPAIRRSETGKPSHARARALTARQKGEKRCVETICQEYL